GASDIARSGSNADTVAIVVVDFEDMLFGRVAGRVERRVSKLDQLVIAAAGGDHRRQTRLWRRGTIIEFAARVLGRCHFQHGASLILPSAAVISHLDMGTVLVSGAYDAPIAIVVAVDLKMVGRLRAGIALSAIHTAEVVVKSSRPFVAIRATADVGR